MRRSLLLTYAYLIGTVCLLFGAGGAFDHGQHESRIVMMFGLGVSILAGIGRLLHNWQLRRLLRQRWQQQEQALQAPSTPGADDVDAVVAQVTISETETGLAAELIMLRQKIPVCEVIHALDGVRETLRRFDAQAKADLN